MVKRARRALPSREDRRSAIATFERWQRSPWRDYVRGRTRAPRMSVSIPILYRQFDQTAWEQAHVVNLSETGVLFGPARIERGRPIEVILCPPIGVGSLAVGKQLCVGEIVRVTNDGTAAARLDECRFVPQSS